MACILIVDDDRAGSAALRILLEFAGFRVIVADSGAAGLEVIRDSRIDAVLLDLHMPGMSGLAALRTMRRSAAAVPVIAMSGFLFRDVTAPGEDVLTEAIALGAAAAIRKPFKPRLLLDAVASCLAATSDQARSPTPASAVRA